jgi:arsenical pump membrane protein
MDSTWIWLISIVTILLIIIRPAKLNEAIWAVLAAVILVATGLMSPGESLFAIAKGIDVYLFLIGMMLLAETARETGLFDWLAIQAMNFAKGSAVRLFLLIYTVGTVVTIFMSNDATAVVLTPAVACAIKSTKIRHPLPYLLICAFIANAASFVLPISNPANLVIYGKSMPGLYEWLRMFLLPSIVSIIFTCIVLFFTQKGALQESIEQINKVPDLSRGGKMALFGIGGTCVILLTSSFTGIITSVIVMLSSGITPVKIVKGVSWAVIPLVAGLFVIVGALEKTGSVHAISAVLERNSSSHPITTGWASGVLTGIVSNIVNNLPVGLLAGSTIQAAHLPIVVQNAILIGVDLGPNLSVTGSLATILWLGALRREGYDISFLKFLKYGFWVMMIPLVLTLAVLFMMN